MPSIPTTEHVVSKDEIQVHIQAPVIDVSTTLIQYLFFCESQIRNSNSYIHYLVSSDLRWRSVVLHLKRRLCVFKDLDFEEDEEDPYNGEDDGEDLRRNLMEDFAEV